MRVIEATKEVEHLDPIELSPLGEQPLISVLLCNYNYAHFIGKAIESVLSQTYSNFELIICDDGSTDNSVDVIREYLGDPRVKLLEKQNGGQATGFNVSFSRSRGEIICFLDADDFYEPTKLERVVDCAITNPCSGCILNGWLRVDKNLTPQGTMPLLASIPAGWYGNELLATGGILVGIPSTPGLNLRREVAEALFPLPLRQPLNRFPDMVMMRLVPLMCRLSGIDEPLAVVRLHGDNSYQSQQVTIKSIEREMSICQELWEEQRKHLEQMDSRLAKKLAPIDAAPIIARQKYIWARLARTPDRWVYYGRLLESIDSTGGSKLQRAFWHITPILPRPIFDRLINVALTQNRFKQLILRLRYIYKRVLHATRNIRTERRAYGDMSASQRRNTGI
jgi:glycosyltransferase involved in cell wall biosynthesis